MLAQEQHLLNMLANNGQPSLWLSPNLSKKSRATLLFFIDTGITEVRFAAALCKPYGKSISYTTMVATSVAQLWSPYVNKKSQMKFSYTSAKLLI